MEKSIETSFVERILDICEAQKDTTRVKNTIDADTGANVIECLLLTNSKMGTCKHVFIDWTSWFVSLGGNLKICVPDELLDRTTNLVQYFRTRESKEGYIRHQRDIKNALETLNKDFK